MEEESSVHAGAILGVSFSNSKLQVWYGSVESRNSVTAGKESWESARRDSRWYKSD